MKPVRFTGRFKKDFRRIQRRGYDLAELQTIIDMLREDRPLPPSSRPHPLKGNWRHYFECHIGPDWLLIYKNTPAELLLAAAGTHSDLFDE